jgi:hypothetical protein
VTTDDALRELRQQWADATMLAWYPPSAREGKEAQERADALWKEITARQMPSDRDRSTVAGAPK